MTHPDLPYEQAKNEEYLEKLEKKLRRNPQLDVDWNVIWIDGASHRQKVVSVLHPLIGRVGLDSEDADLGRSFYIGAETLRPGRHPRDQLGRASREGYLVPARP